MLSFYEGMSDGSRASSFKQRLLESPPSVLPSHEYMRIVGSPDADHYLMVMRDSTADIIETCQLRKEATVLDLGCGCGRIATGLTYHLDSHGSYCGFDVWNDGIEWCKRNISPGRENFRFHTVRANNNYYHSDDSGGENRFDTSFVSDDSLDCAFAVSLFTHLKLADAHQYFELLVRALEPTGVAYLTFFLIDDYFFHYQRHDDDMKAVQSAGDGTWTGWSHESFFVGFEPRTLFEAFQRHGLTVLDSSLGTWANKPGGRIYQDWFLVRR
jgi:SAM-dependent methyltransferase